jgi:hypothetical protein
MLIYTPLDLQARFSLTVSNALKAYQEALTVIAKLQTFGVDVDIECEKDVKRIVYTELLKNICVELTTSNQGLGRDVLAHENYAVFVRAKGCFTDVVDAIEDIDYKGLAEALEEDSKKLEEAGYATSAKLLSTSLLGYNKDKVKRSKSGYLCELSHGSYAFDVASTMEELKKQLSVALSVVGEGDVDLACFDEYICAVRPKMYPNELDSRSVYGSKKDRVSITHFKEKAVFQISPVLFESIVAFIASFYGSDFDFELPCAA